MGRGYSDKKGEPSPCPLCSASAEQTFHQEYRTQETKADKIRCSNKDCQWYSQYTKTSYSSFDRRVNSKKILIDNWNNRTILWLHQQIAIKAIFEKFEEMKPLTEKLKVAYGLHFSSKKRKELGIE